MHYPYLLFFLTFSALAQPKMAVQVLSNPQSIEDFDHQFKGCPENSECDQVMGLQMDRWKSLITKLKDAKMVNSKKTQLVEEFRSKSGIPVEFYTHQKSQLGFKPILYNSPCKFHENKNKDEKVLRGISFVKSLNSKRAIIWRDQTQFEVPIGELIIPQDITVTFAQSSLTYQVPIGDQPLFIKNKELYILKEYDGYFYMLKVSQTGDWKIVDVDFSKLSYWEEKRENIVCPAEKNKLKSNYFETDFCKTILDEDTKKSVTVKMRQSCII